MRNESDKKYNLKMPLISFRIPEGIKNQIPKPRGPWIKELVIRELQTDDTRKYENSDHDLLIVLLRIFIENRIQAPIPKELIPKMKKLIELEVM